MNPQTFLIMFSSTGIALFVLAVVLLALSKEGRIVLTAKLTKKPLLVKINPEARVVKLERIPDVELVEKKGETYFLGGWPNYRWGGVKVFFVIENDTIDYPPEIVAEIQKALKEGYENFDKLKEAIVEYEEKVIEVKNPDGTTGYQKITIPKFKPIVGRAHRVISIRPLKKSKGVSLVIEEFTPIDYLGLATFYNRKFGAEAIKKILKIKDTECLEKVQQVYSKLLKKLKIEDKSQGRRINPVWLIYIGIFIFIVLMGLSMYGGKIFGGGGVKPLPPSP